jgi:Uma2 family endonuclease
MTRTPISTPPTLQAYFEREASSPEKHEYRDGQIIQMPASPPDHTLIAATSNTFLVFIVLAN